jgi:hypothetical protein
MGTVSTDDDVMSLKTVATEDHNNDEWFGDITEEALSKRVTRYLLLKSNPPQQRRFVVVMTAMT